MGYTAAPGAVISFSVEGANASQRQIDSIAQSMSNLSGIVQGAMRNLAATVGLGGGLVEIVQMSDQYSKLTSQLRLATQSNREYAAAYADVRRIANDAQADLASTGVLYARIANGTRELGISQQRVAGITEAVNLALKVSGATAEESASAQLQLSQAFAAGALRGEEFNSVNEAAPRLMKALADGIGVPVGALKQMASDGKITAQVMADVLPKALGQLRQEADQVQTIGGAFTVLKNRVLEFTATNAQSSGAVSALTGSIKLLADNLQLVSGAAVTLTAAKLGSWLGNAATQAVAAATANRTLALSNLATAEANATGTASASLLANARVAELRTAVLASEGAAQLAIATNGLVPAEARATAAAEAHAAAMLELSVAQRAASVSTSATSAVIGALGGPIGATITVLGLAATAWSWYESKSEAANSKASESTEQSTGEIIASLEKQNAKLRERIELSKQAGMGPVARESGADTERLAALLRQINSLKEKGNALNAVDQIQLINLQGIYDDLARTMSSNRGLKSELDAGGTALTNLVAVRERLTGVNKQYLDDLAALQTAREKGAIGEREYIALVSQLATDTYKSSDAGKAATTAAAKQTEAFQTLISAIRSKTEETRLELAIGQNATESQKTLIKLEQELASGKLKLSAASLAVVRAALEEQAASEQSLRAQAAQRDVTKFIVESTAARTASATALQLEYDMYGKSADAHEMALVALRAEADMEKKLADLRSSKLPISAQVIAQLKAERDARVLVEQATLGQGRALTYASQLAVENRRFAAEAIFDQDARARALTEIDADTWRERIRLAGDGTEAQKLLQQQFDQWYQNQHLKPQLDADKKMWDSVEQTAHDTFISIFDSGKSAFDRLRDALKNGLLDLLYQMTVKKWIVNISGAVSGGGIAGVAQAAGVAGGSGGGSALGSTLGGVAGSMFGAGGLAGSLAAGAGWLTGATTLGGSLAAGASLIGTGTMAGAMSGLGMMAGALGPIALGIGAVMMLAKAVDHSGTYHTGGAASASSSGTSTIRAESLHFEATRTSADTEKWVSGLASGIVNILDSTALAFGKTAGYTAATAFADDSSKDGAWGGLVISKLGKTLVDWQATRGNGPWAPKVFADGEAGQKQYLAALSSSVRTALNDIGLPDWAKTMLNGLGSNASLEDMAKVVDSINTTERALAAMKDNLAGFAQMSDKATTALIAAAGGIDNLSSGASAYFDNFYSDTEKSASTVKQISELLAAVGVAMPATREAFRAEVEAEMALGEQGAPAVAALLKVAGAFAQVYPALDATATSAKSAADVLHERTDLQKQLDELTLSSAQQLDKQRAALDASNQGLFDQVQAAQRAKAAQDAAKTSLGDYISKMQTFSAATKALRDGLLTGSLSTLTPEQQYAELRRQLDTTAAGGRAGDATAEGNWNNIANAFLTASQKINGGDSQFGRDSAMVLAMNDQMAQWATGQANDAQSSLDLLNAQVAGIADLNATMQQVAQGIQQLPAAFAGAPVTGLATPINYAGMGALDMAPLVAEVKALRAEVTRLRDEQNKQTGDTITSNAQVQQQSTRTIVDDLGGALQRVEDAIKQRVVLE
jgi:tape measure domain-containing protein